MVDNNQQPGIDRFVRGIIHRKVRMLIGRAGFREHERQDLEQELVLRLLQSIPLFDAKQAHWNVFVTTVIERAVAQILRDRRAAKRNGGDQVGSLDTFLETEDEGEVRVLLPIIEDQSTLHERADLSIDIVSVLARLPDDLRDLAQRLQRQSLSQAARDLGVSRSTLQRRLEHLRRHFEEAGLKNCF